MQISLFVLISCLLLGGVELIKRKLALSASVTRRATHIGAALIAAASPLYVGQRAIVIVCLVFALVTLLSRRTRLLSSVHDIERPSFGDVYLPLGEALAAVLFLPHDVIAFQYGVLVMGISDAFAGLIGELYGAHLIAPFLYKKTLEGTFVFFICTLVLTMFFFGGSTHNLVIIALVLTLVELASIRGLDNLFLPTFGGFLLRFFT